MAMRESAKSLRAYFVVAGVLLTGSALTNLQAPDGGTQFLGLMSLVFGLGFLRAGIRLPRYLNGSTTFIRILIYSNLAYQLFLAGVGLLAGAGSAALIFPVIASTISWYLIVNVERLSQEARAVATA